MLSIMDTEKILPGSTPAPSASLPIPPWLGSAPHAFLQLGRGEMSLSDLGSGSCSPRTAELPGSPSIPYLAQPGRSTCFLQAGVGMWNRGVRRNRQFPVSAFLPPPVTVWFPNNASDKEAGIPFNF